MGRNGVRRLKERTERDGERNQNPDGVEATGRVAGHKSINLTTTNINIGSKHSEKLNYLSSTRKIRG